LDDLSIREYRSEDAAGVRQCIVELQDFERRVDERLRPGESIARPFLEHILQQCAECAGTILVAEHAGLVVGFATILTKVPYRELDDPPGTYALLSDLVVREHARRKGIGEALLREAEHRTRRAAASVLRVGVLSGNHDAMRLYERVGFKPYLLTMEKRLGARRHGPDHAR
jgi:ribosomal protein S18 acetylase RimI-like enzyme